MKTHTIGALALLITGSLTGTIGAGVGYAFGHDPVVEYENTILANSLEECEELSKDYFEAAAIIVGKATQQPAVDIPLSSGKTLRVPALRPKTEASGEK